MGFAIIFPRILVFNAPVAPFGLMSNIYYFYLYFAYLPISCFYHWEGVRLLTYTTSTFGHLTPQLLSDLVYIYY